MFILYSELSLGCFLPNYSGNFGGWGIPPMLLITDFTVVFIQVDSFLFETLLFISIKYTPPIITITIISAHIILFIFLY